MWTHDRESDERPRESTAGWVSPVSSHVEIMFCPPRAQSTARSWVLTVQPARTPERSARRRLPPPHARVQLTAGGGGSFEWLPDEPGFESPEAVGFFMRMKKATTIMNIMNM